jgi:hypothetical protein
MQCGGSKKMGYMDLGGNFVDMSNKYQAVEPTSGYGTMPGPGDGAKHAKAVRKRQAQRTKVARKNIGNCRRGANGQMICS